MGIIQGFLFKEANPSMKHVSTYGGVQCVEGLLKLDLKNITSNQKVLPQSRWPGVLD